MSDDSANALATRETCRLFPNVRYLAGPRRGLCANRNAVIRASAADYISLLDDDAAVSDSFVYEARLFAAKAVPKTILTGPVIEPGKVVEPANPGFWGHFTLPPQGHYKTINLNSNVFPRAAFAAAYFDEAIAFGYEDMDLCARLISTGFSIQYETKLMNFHFPASTSGAISNQRASQIELARFYTSLKRYLLWERRKTAFLAFVVLAPLHRAAHAILCRKWNDLARCLPDMALSIRALLRERACLREQGR